MKTILWTLLALAGLWPRLGAAVVLDAASAAVNPVHEVQLLEDPTGTLGWEQVRGMAERFRPWTQGGEELNFGFTNSAYWIRIPLQRTQDAPRHWLLAVNYASLNELDLYAPGQPPVRTGSLQPLSTRPYFDRHFVFPIEASLRPEYFYLRATSRYVLSVPLQLWQPSAYQARQQRAQFLQFGYYGALAAVFTFSLLFCFLLRDRRFLLYSGYVLAVGLGIFAGNGYGQLFLWPDAPRFDEVAQNALLGLAAYLLLQLARQLLHSREHMRGADWGMRVSGLAFLVITALELARLWQTLPPLKILNQSLMLNAIAMGALILLASAQALLIQRRREVRFFLLGWLLLWAGVTISGLRAFGWLPSNGFTSYALQIATALETLLLGLALSDVVKTEYDAMLQAKAGTLAHNEELLGLLRDSEARLQQTVQERTAQLEGSLLQERQMREQYVRFGSMISHEFRTPLGIIQSQLSLMRKEREHGVDHTADRMEAIGSATRRLSVMFDKWLQSDALGQSLEALDCKPLQLAAWVQDQVHANAHLLLNHRLELRLHPDAQPVRTDEYHLGVALTNLLDNAAKYSPPGSAITVETRVRQGQAGIAVIDQGPGIAPELQAKVFSDFYRVAPESAVRGTGLGLAFVRRIVAALGGQVELLSAPGQGATFCLWLPVQEPLESAA